MHSDEPLSRWGAVNNRHRPIDRGWSRSPTRLTAPLSQSQLQGCPYTSDMASNAPSVHDQIALGLREHPAKKGLPLNIFVTVFEIGGSITLFHFARRMGASDVVSYLVGSIAPVLGGPRSGSRPASSAEPRPRSSHSPSYPRLSPWSVVPTPRCCFTRTARQRP